MTNRQHPDTEAPRDPEATRAAILNATRDMISERGESGVRVAEVAARAGVTTGAIYGHFESREGLLVAAHMVYLRAQSAAFLDLFRQASAASGDTGNADKAYSTFVRALLSPDGQSALLHWAEAAAAAETNPVFAAQLRPLEVSLLDQTKAHVEEQKAAGLVAAELDTRAIAALRVAASLGVAITGRVYADDPTFETALFSAWPYLIRSFAPRVEGPHV